MIRFNSDGTLDDGFGSGGTVLGAVVTNIGTSTGSSTDDFGRSLVIQSDGKIVVGGTNYRTTDTYDFAVVRYTASGSLDTTFSVDGKQTAALSPSLDQGQSVLVQPDGKIVMAGFAYVGGATTASSDFALARFTSSGSLDGSFGWGGIATTAIGVSTSDAANAATLYPDGRIVVAGSSGAAFALARYTTNGSLDTSFGTAVSSTTTFSTTVNYTEGGSAVLLHPTIRLTDRELDAQAHYGGLSLTLSREGGANTQDAFESGSSLLGALTQGSSLTAGGTVIGSVTQNSSGTLAFSFNSSATQNLVNLALQGIAYRNISDSPAITAWLTWTFSDGNSGAQGGGGADTATGSSMVNIMPVNDAPVLTPASPQFTSITEDTANGSGQTLTSLLGMSLSDPDASAALGIALHGVTGSYGQWQYSTNAGTSWADVGTVSESAALLLRGSDLLRWQPDTTNGSYAGWDHSAGNAGSKVSLAARGGTTAFSTDSNTMNLAVTSVADSPRLITPIADTSTTEEVALSYTVPSGTFAEVDLGDGIVGYSANLIGGAALSRWLNFDANTRTFSGTPAADDVGVYDVTVTAVDSTNRSTSDTFRLTVAGINDAPVLTAASPALSPITEDDLDTAGQTVASILGNSLSDADAQAVEGIALQSVSGNNGRWQFSADVGSNWSDVGSVSPSAALLLRSTDLLRWQPDRLDGTTATLNYFGWDQTAGTAGTKVNVATGGGTTAYSTASDTATLAVGSVNDAPALLMGDGIVTTSMGSFTGGSINYQYEVALQADGRIVVAATHFDGTDHDFALVRYRADGSLDPTLGGTLNSGRVLLNSTPFTERCMQGRLPPHTCT